MNKYIPNKEDAILLHYLELSDKKSLLDLIMEQPDFEEKYQEWKKQFE